MVPALHAQVDDDVLIDRGNLTECHQQCTDSILQVGDALLNDVGCQVHQADVGILEFP